MMITLLFFEGILFGYITVVQFSILLIDFEHVVTSLTVYYVCNNAAV